MISYIFIFLPRLLIYNIWFIFFYALFSSIFFHFLLSYSILFYFLLFYSILSYPILSYTILSYPILYYSYLPYFIIFYIFLSFPAFELLERKRYKMSWGPATGKIRTMVVKKREEIIVKFK